MNGFSKKSFKRINWLVVRGFDVLHSEKLSMYALRRNKVVLGPFFAWQLSGVAKNWRHGNLK